MSLLQHSQWQMYIVKRTGDFFYLSSLIIIIASIFVKKSVQGLSKKTFLLLLIAFLMRYNFFITYDMSSTFVVVERIFLVGCLAIIILLMTVYKETYNEKQDKKTSMLMLTLISIIFGLYYGRYDSGFGSFSIAFSYCLQSLSFLCQLSLIYNLNSSYRVLTCMLYMISFWKFMYFGHAMVHEQPNCIGNELVCQGKFICWFLESFICLIGGVFSQILCKTKSNLKCLKKQSQIQKLVIEDNFQIKISDSLLIL